MEEYQKTYDSAYEMLDNLGHKPESAGVMAKTMAHLTSDVKTISDNSPSKIAEMVIQGNTMGVTKMTKRIHEYDGDNKKIVALAQKHVAMEEDNIEEVKQKIAKVQMDMGNNGEYIPEIIYINGMRQHSASNRSYKFPEFG